MLEKVASLHAFEEGVRIEEIIIDAFALTRSGRTSSAGDDATYLGARGEQLLPDSGFAAAGRPGDEHKQGTRVRSHMADSFRFRYLRMHVHLFQFFGVFL